MPDKFPNLETAAVTKSQSIEYLTMRKTLPLLPMKVTPAAPLRWARDGVLCRNGERVYLKHIRMGGRILTREAWIQEFFDAQVAANIAPRPARMPPMNPERNLRKTIGGLTIRSHAEADAHLKAKGM
ncbi:hypothetical protein LLG95_12965 [bacterium]|nr:hypothetical protein [bacterium]